jgi:hypothetical protein
MKLRLGRIALAAVIAEVAGVLALIVLVTIFKPADPDQVQAFAEHLGTWVGPISGFVFCAAGGYWVARRGSPYCLGNGVAMGLAGAFVDIVAAAALGASLQILLVVSNLGRIMGGTLGGFLASRKLSGR